MKPKIFFLLLLTFSIFHTTSSIAEVRFVNKTGSSTPPYTSWETAADSIQKAVNIAEVGDTIYVANGTYNESIYIDKTINLWGSSADSTVISGVGTPNNYILYFWGSNSLANNSTLKNFKLTSPNYDKIGIRLWYTNLNTEKCIITEVRLPILIYNSSPRIEGFYISNFTSWGLYEDCTADTCHGVYRNNVITATSATRENPVDFVFGGNPTIEENLIIYVSENSGSLITGLHISAYVNAYIKNNIVIGFGKHNFPQANIGTSSDADTTVIVNNVASYSLNGRGITINNGNKLKLRNNILSNNKEGITIDFGNTANSNYNLFWENDTDLTGMSYGDSDIVADPMFVKDTLPNSQLDFDYHLQKYSPAIDAGDPEILDVDGSRSDIGVFGGPGGQMYTYMDLAPKPPRNLTASLDSGLVHLKWNKNTEADLFRYRVYRDTVSDFIYDITKIIATVADTFYYDDVPDKFNSGNYYYKLTAIDTAVNQSAASEEVHVNVTGIPEAPPVVIEHYRLLQNYPNPFNPTTTIPYRLKEGGYVKIMVYNLVGELVRVLVNQHQSAGYYEVEFNPNKSERKKAEGYVEFETGYYGNVASGIYLYRIEVIGEGRIPVYSDMKKMILLK